MLLLGAIIIKKKSLSLDVLYFISRCSLYFLFVIYPYMKIFQHSVFYTLPLTIISLFAFIRRKILTNSLPRGNTAILTSIINFKPLYITLGTLTKDNYWIITFREIWDIKFYSIIIPVSNFSPY